jgi:hypothetical protein
MDSLLFISLLLLVLAAYYVVRFPSISGIPNASRWLPVLGNANSFGSDPVKYLLSQRARHGDIIHVNTPFAQVVFFFGRTGTNAILNATENSGISYFAGNVFLSGPLVTQSIT